jgi:DNA replicative helicase MCM subunit Mcm2 (Cdc46/Mcm family)
MIFSHHCLDRLWLSAACPWPLACRYNLRVPLTSQLNISGPLLSRFDIVILLLDQMSPEWDEFVANHILHTHHRRGGAGASSGNGGAGGSNSSQQQQQQQADAAEVSYAWCVAIF